MPVRMGPGQLYQYHWKNDTQYDETAGSKVRHFWIGQKYS